MLKNRPHPALKRKNTVFQPSSVRCELLVGKVPGSVYIHETSVGQAQQYSKGIIYFIKSSPETEAKPALHKTREHKQHIYIYIHIIFHKNIDIFQPNKN